MAVTDINIKFYHTGASSDGSSQSDPNASLGNYRSSSQISPGSENLFDNVSSADRASGSIEYRCLCIKNTNGSDSLTNPIVWIDVDTGNIEDAISFAIEVPSGNGQTGNAQTIVNETTPPSVGAGNVSSWSDATTKLTGISVDQGAHDVNLDAGEILFMWLRRVVAAGSSPASDSFTLKIEGDP